MLIKFLNIKRVFFCLLITTVLGSCSLIFSIIPPPNDDPGWPHRVSTFRTGQEMLQVETDKFIENNKIILRKYDGRGYDKDIYRQYRTVCNNDTFDFNINFNGDDTISRIVVRFFRLRNIPFRISHYKEQKQTIKKNRALYDTCQACYDKIFLLPLREYLKGKK